jgi:hypothetical protein
VVARRLTTALIVLTSAVGLGACGDEYVRGAGVYSTTTTVPAQPATTPTPTPGAPVQTTDSGGTENTESERLTATQRRAVRGASTAARSFLDGYLPYSYGKRDARSIRSVSPDLRSTLVRQAPRVPPALAAKARPRLTRLDVSGIDDQGRVMLLAHIDDGQGRYAALLTLQRRGQRWAVAQVR